MGQSGSYPIEHTFDIQVDHSVPLVNLEESKRRDRHNAGIVHQDIDLAVCVDGLLYSKATLGNIDVLINVSTTPHNADVVTSAA